MKSATPIRETDLDESSALSASNGASADTVRLQFRKFKKEDKSRKARESRSARKTHKRKPRLNKKDEPVIREVIRDKDERDINVSDEQAKRRRRPRR